MSDRELLEAAAKAAKRAGLNVLRDPNGMFRDCTGAHPEANIFRCRDWSPLTDDGDALRLAVALDLSSLMVFSYPTNGTLGKRREFWTPNSGYDGGKSATTEAEYAADPYAATRRAIVRAAAALAHSA